MMDDVQHQVRVLEDGRYQVYRTKDGIRKADVGPKWETPFAAGSYADLMDRMPWASPLREQTEPHKHI